MSTNVQRYEFMPSAEEQKQAALRGVIIPAISINPVLEPQLRPSVSGDQRFPSGFKVEVDRENLMIGSLMTDLDQPISFDLTPDHPVRTGDVELRYDRLGLGGSLIRLVFEKAATSVVTGLEPWNQKLWLGAMVAQEATGMKRPNFRRLEQQHGRQANTMSRQFPILRYTLPETA